VYLINRKYLGDEPEANKIKTKVDIINAVNWYGMMCDKDDAREYLTEWLAKQNNTLSKRIKSIPDNWVPLSMAWQCRIADRTGIAIEPELHSRIVKAVEFAVSKGSREAPEGEKKAIEKVSIQDRMADRASDIIGEIEALIDSGEPFSLYDWLKKNEIPASYSSRIIAYYTPWLGELLDALQSGLEGYENWSKPKLRDRIKQLSALLEDANKYGEVTKKTRSPRKPRPVSTEKLLKNLKYQKESNEYKLASINPEGIIGCQELWCFNTKYKNVTVFRAIDRAGLTVKRSSIANYDEKTSFTKSTGRQTEKVLDKLRNGGKIVLKKLMDELKTDKALQDRINENTILVKVVK